MKPTPITIAIFLSIVLVVTAAGLYWMAMQTKAGEHRLAISTVQHIQQLESQWSVEVARVRSDPFADFDSLTQFIPRMDRLKKTLASAIQGTPSLPDRLVNTTNAYLSAIAAKEERIERFKTGYAVLRNSVRYLPLAASNVMQQMQTRGANSAFIRNVAIITDEITTYLASPAPPEKERLTRMLSELGNSIATRHPALVNTAMNFVAHGQVLLEKQAPTEEVFRAATSSQISELGETIITGLESDREQATAQAAWYERGIIGTGTVLWMMWLTIAFRMPRGKDKTRRESATSLQQNPLLSREQAGPRPDGGLEHLTADLMKTGQLAGADPTAALELAAYQVRVDIVAEQLVTLAERINSSTGMLTDTPDQPAYNGAEFAAGDAPHEDREVVAATIASIHTRTDDIVELAKRLPTLAPVVAGADPTAVPEFAAYQVRVDIVAEQLVTLAEHINSSTQVLTDTPHEDREVVAATITSIHTRTDDIVELAKRLLTLAPKRAEGPAPLDLNDYIDEVADRIQAKSGSLIVNKESNPLPAVVAAESDVSLMFTNIMENAAAAIQERGQKQGFIRVETKQESDSVVVTITDNGTGIRPEHRMKVFSPFYTTREGALGMGLTVTQHLVEKYGGSILMNSMPNQGTVVRVTLPTSTRTQQGTLEP